MKKSILIIALAVTSVMYGAPTDPAGPWQVVADAAAGANPNPTTAAPGIITSSTNNGADGNPATAGDNTNAAYWNNPSADATVAPGIANGCYNIGCFLTGSGVWGTSAGLTLPTVPSATNPANPNNSPNLSNPVYLGNNDGSALTNMYFGGGTGLTGGTTLLAEVAGNSGANWLGWYDQAFVAANGLSALTVGDGHWGIIYNGQTAPTTTASFTPTASFGLFLLPNYAGTNGNGTGTDAGALATLKANSFLTESGKSASDLNNQHFAIFARSAAAAGVIPVDFWVGVEDTLIAGGAGGSDRDYNDMVIYLRIVPEPGYYALLALGLGGLALARRRTKTA